MVSVSKKTIDRLFKVLIIYLALPLVSVGLLSYFLPARQNLATISTYLLGFETIATLFTLISYVPAIYQEPVSAQIVTSRVAIIALSIVELVITILTVLLSAPFNMYVMMVMIFIVGLCYYAACFIALTNIYYLDHRLDHDHILEDAREYDRLLRYTMILLALALYNIMLLILLLES